MELYDDAVLRHLATKVLGWKEVAEGPPRKFKTPLGEVRELSLDSPGDAVLILQTALSRHQLRGIWRSFCLAVLLETGGEFILQKRDLDALKSVFRGDEKFLQRIARLWDLCRYQRNELHAAGLVSDEEFAALAGPCSSVVGLETYDGLRMRVLRMEAALRQIIQNRVAAEGICGGNCCEARPCSECLAREALRC
jgi:hypothetical protein